MGAPSHERGADAFPIVGVGASAGGLEAFTQLLKLLPDDSGMAFVLIQHQDLLHPSPVGETLTRATRMNVRQADDGVVVEPNHVYVIPPTAQVAMLRGRLSLMPRRLGDRHSPLSIDHFLQSLAADRGSHAIGVVLSGNASDGIEGLRAIKAEHGITFAQTPTTARFAQMPRGAVQAGVVDAALAIPELAQELMRLSAHPYVSTHAPTLASADGALLDQILAVVREVGGVDFSEYKGSTLERRLARRMAVRRAETPRQYLALLRRDREEVRVLFEDIRMHVTSSEELQSTNEALETAQEALQSTNDEMTAANDQLQTRNLEVTQINSDLLNLLVTVDIPIVILDLQRRIRLFTPRATTVLKVLPSDHGRPFSEITSNLDVPDLDAQFAEVIQNASTRESEVQDGQGHWYRMQLRPYRTTDNRIDGAILSLVDIDALKLNINKAQVARAEAEHANEAKDVFLAVLGHELRTPLASLLLHAQRLRRGGAMDVAKLVRAGEAIERATRMQMQLINDLLDVSRIVAGKLKVELVPVNLCAAVQTAIDSVSAAAERKSIKLEVAIDEAVGEVAGDATRLEQVVSNLLTNAVKFTLDGGQVFVKVDAANGQARVRVSDTGMGIDPQFMPRVFDRFSQQDSSTSRAHGGLGLGLAIVRNLVDQHGGTVQAESPGLGKGATFTVTLPLLPSAAPATEPPPVSAGPKLVKITTDISQIKDLRILLVDDDRATAEALGEMLKEMGATVRVTESAALAMSALDEFRPTVLLCDIAMPQEDGYSLIRRLRKLAPRAGGGIPALALTALASSDDQQRALAAGFQMHLTKPVDIDRLSQAVVALLASGGGEYPS